MLARLRRLLAGREAVKAPGKPPSPGSTAVAFDTGRILLYQSDGRCGSIKWDDLGSVTLATMADSDIGADAFWLLLNRDRSQFLAVPVGADGEQDLLLAMQLRLRGFDNEAVIEAMTSTETEHFAVWDAAG